MSVSYIPDQNTYKEMTPFKRFVLQSFPWIDANFDALTNYELMGKIIEYLNDIISNENAVQSNVTALYNAFVSLQSYVNNYFDNLNVQNEINKKLDSMVEDGTIPNILSGFYDDINARIDLLDTKIDSVASGSPLAATSTSGMTDTTKIYVNTTDGYWYYYNGTQWTQGGVYQASVNDSNFSGTSQNALENRVITNNIARFLDSGIAPFNVFAFARGSANSLNSRNTQTHRVSTISQVAERDFKVKVLDKDFRVYIYYSTDGGTTTQNTGWKTSTALEFEIKKGWQYAISIARITEDTSETADVSVFVNKIGKSYFNERTYIEPYLKSIDFNNGSAVSIRGTNNSTPYRVHCINKIAPIDFNLIVNDPNFRIYVYTSPDTDLTHQTISGWVQNYKIKKGEYYAFTIGRKTDVTTEIADIDEFISKVTVSNISMDDIIRNIPTSYYLTNYKWVSREGRIAGAPGNSIYGAIASKKNGYSQMRVSVRKTSDNVFVLSHDDAINSEARNSDGTELSSDVLISTSTISQLDGYDFGIKYGNAYAGLKITRLLDFIPQIAKLGLELTIEPKITLTDSEFNEIRDVLSLYGYTKNVLWSGGQDLCEQAKRLMPQSSLGKIVHFDSANLSQFIALKNDINYVRCDAFYNDTYTPSKVREFQEAGIDIKVGSAYNISDIVTFANMGIKIIEVANVNNPQMELDNYIENNL